MSFFFDFYTANIEKLFYICIIKIKKMENLNLISLFLIMFGLFGLISTLYNISKKGKKDLLEEMFKNNDISGDVYKKYLDK
jgi:hypothetical protein